MHEEFFFKFKLKIQITMIFTTSFGIRQVLEEMEMISAFTSVLHVPNLSKPEHVLAVLEEHDIFDKKDLATLAKRMSGHKYELILDVCKLQFFYRFFYCNLQSIYWHQKAIGLD